MLLARRIFTPATSNSRNYQVTVLGAANEVGQTICLLLRAQPSITKLVMHDTLEQTPGVIMDVSNIPASSAIQGYKGDETLERALKGSDIVIATGGLCIKPGVAKKTWFLTNTGFIIKVAKKIAKTVTPMPFVGIVTEPINTMVPMAAEVMKNNGDYDGKKLFGITTIDILRAQILYALENNLHPQHCFVPVIGGHSDKTTIPLVSQAHPICTMNEKLVQEFTSRVRKGDALVIQAKKGWSPTVSVAYSALVFIRGILNALEGRTTKVNAYVENNDFGTSYFSGLVTVSKDGAGEMQRYTDLSEYECHLLERSIDHLRKDISKGKKILELA